MNIGYWGMQFIMLDVSRVHKMNMNMFYSLHIIIFSVLIALHFSGIMPFLKKKEIEYLKNLEGHTQESDKKKK